MSSTLGPSSGQLMEVGQIIRLLFSRSAPSSVRLSVAFGVYSASHILIIHHICQIVFPLQDASDQIYSGQLSTHSFSENSEYATIIIDWRSCTCKLRMFLLRLELEPSNISRSYRRFSGRSPTTLARGCSILIAHGAYPKHRAHRKNKSDATRFSNALGNNWVQNSSAQCIGEIPRDSVLITNQKKIGSAQCCS